MIPIAAANTIVKNFLSDLPEGSERQNRIRHLEALKEWRDAVQITERMEAERLQKVVLDYNEVLRSAYHIAERNGPETGWETSSPESRKHSMSTMALG